MCRFNDIILPFTWTADLKWLVCRIPIILKKPYDCMSFIDNVLQMPSYGWKDENGDLIVPSTKQLWTEAFSRINVFKCRKNWMSMTSWLMAVLMLPFFFAFVFFYFSWPLVIAIIVYSMIVMGTHGTIWFHRFCTHNSYKFSHPLWRIITQNLVLKTF